MSIRRPFALVAVICLAVVFAPAAGVASGQAPDAMIRGGHFSPNTPGVDVYLTSFAGKTTKLWLSGVGYGDVSGYERITPGLYTVAMRPHGAAASTPPALTWTLNAHAGDAYTACAVGLNAQLHGIVLHDDLQAAPSSARVRIIQAASRAPHADVVAVNGPTLAHNVAFATSTNYTSVHSGSYTIKASAVGDAAVRATAHASFKADSVHTVVVLDSRAKGITVRVLDDAAGAAVAPVGAAPAGGGGTAKQPDASSTGPLFAGAAVVATLLAGALLIRRRRTA